MKLSPLDIKKQEFTRTLRRGYDPDEVEAFLDMMASQWEDMLNEQRRMDDKVRELKAKMEHYEKIEEALQEALKTARENAQQKIEHAKREAALIVKEAFGDAEDIAREAVQQRDMLLKEVKELSGRRDEIVARLRAFLMSEAELLARFENRQVDATPARGSSEKKEAASVAEDAVEEPEMAAMLEDAVAENEEDVVDEPDDLADFNVDEPEEADIFADVANAVKNAVVEQGVVRAVADRESGHRSQEGRAPSTHIPVFDEATQPTAELEALIDEAVPPEADDAVLNTEELEEVLRKMAVQEDEAEDYYEDEPAVPHAPEIEVEVIEQTPPPEIEVEVMGQDATVEEPEVEPEVLDETHDSFFRENVPDHFSGDTDAMSFKFFEPTEKGREGAKFFQNAEGAQRFSTPDDARKKGRAPSRSHDRSPADNAWNARKNPGAQVPEHAAEEGSIAPSEEVEKIRRILSDLE